MEKFSYLDNSATTRVCEPAVRVACAVMTGSYGNPSSLHSLGIEAERFLTRARERVAERLAASQEEIVFTSGGTEANNLALFGAAEAGKRKGGRIVTTAVEHPSVLESVKRLEQDGFEAVFLPVDGRGIVSEEALEEAIDPNTILVSVMHVNNETGSVQPVEQLRRIVTRKRAPALIHVDAVQSFGKLPLRPERMGIDLLSLSGHKIHAPKGVGALYIARGVRILPRSFGGGQEKGRRSGTEALPLIAALGAAVDALPAPEEELAHQRLLAEHLKTGLSEFPEVIVNSPDAALPGIVNFSVRGLRAEVLLHHLASQGVYVSSGSACAKGKSSHVLQAMGLERNRIESAVRASFSRFTAEEELDRLLEGVRSALQVLTRTGK